MRSSLVTELEELKEELKREINRLKQEEKVGNLNYRLGKYYEAEGLKTAVGRIERRILELGREDRMLTNEEKKKIVNRHFDNLIFAMRAHLDMSEEDVLIEIEKEINERKKKEEK